MIFAPFSAIVFIILYFGNHSTNMWLTHMQYYSIFASSFVFMSRNVFVIFITLIILSLVSSYVIEFIFKIISIF